MTAGEGALPARPDLGKPIDAAIAASVLARAGGRIARLQLANETVWLKDFDQPTSAKWHHAQRVASLITRLRLLRPVPSQSGIAGAEHEMESMRRFREIGARVPELLWARGAKIAISDIGETLRDIERRSGGIETPAIAAARELGRIHSHGLVHGRPILRNLTWDGERVGFIDFEEQPLSVMPLDTARARDLLLLLISAGRRNGAGLVEGIVSGYAEKAPPAVESELRRITRAARPFARLGKIFSRSSNRDVIGFRRAIDALDAARRFSTNNG